VEYVDDLEQKDQKLLGKKWENSGKKSSGKQRGLRIISVAPLILLVGASGFEPPAL
jgi:hypothetical protein